MDWRCRKGRARVGWPAKGVMMAALNEEIISVLDKMLLDDRRVRPGKMLYVGLKLAVCL